MTLSWQDGDRIFERLTEVTVGLDDGQLAAFLARLVFLLADAVDDGGAVLEAVEAAARARRGLA
jgi:hypothetical protein